MASYPPPYTPPPNDWKYQKQAMKEQARMQRDAMRAQRDLYRHQMRAARRSSILGPIILIAIGVVFLLIQTGRLSGYLVWNWYARWWPLLLVGAGVLILLEWALDRFMQTDDQPIVRRSVGGGLWLLFIFAILFGISSSAVRGDHRYFLHGLKINDDSIDEFFGNKHEIDQPFTQAFPAGSTLIVDNPKGGINVSGTSDDGQMHIQLHRIIYSTSDSEANSKAQQLIPKFDTTGNQISVSLPTIDGAQADMTITVPTATPLTVTTNHGDIDISEIKAPISVTSNHGDVSASGITGAVTAHVNNNDSSFSAHSITGPVNVEARGHDLNLSDINGTVVANGEFFGSIHFSHISGAVNLHTSRDDFQVAKLDGQYEMNGREISTDQAVGPVLLATHSRNLTLDRVSGAVSVTNSNGSIDLSSVAPLGNVTIENRSGSVNVTVPEHSSFTYQTSTVDGNLSSDFPGVGQSSSNRRNGSSGTVGAGGSAIHITTSHGDIAIRKAFLSSAPIAPVKPLAPLKPELESDSAATASTSARTVCRSSAERTAARSSSVRTDCASPRTPTAARSTSARMDCALRREPTVRSSTLARMACDLPRARTVRRTISGRTVRGSRPGQMGVLLRLDPTARCFRTMLCVTDSARPKTPYAEPGNSATPL